MILGFVLEFLKNFGFNGFGGEVKQNIIVKMKHWG
jgi:hypothetical protein